MCVATCTSGGTQVGACFISHGSGLLPLRVNCCVEFSAERTEMSPVAEFSLAKVKQQEKSSGALRVLGPGGLMCQRCARHHRCGDVSCHGRTDGSLEAGSK